MEKKNIIKNRYDFVLLFDATKSNPNGDPDSGNLPRIDNETGKGLVTDACIKRKIRNEVDLRYGHQAGYNMYIKPDAYLNSKDLAAIKTVYGVEDEKDIAAAVKASPELGDEVMRFLCENYYDNRTFGAVATALSKHKIPGAKNVKGPVTVCTAESISPVDIVDLSIARTTVATEKEAESGNMNTFGSKPIVMYGLYRAYGSVDPILAQKNTGMTEEDLDIFFEAMEHMFDHDASAIRPNMSVRAIVIFKHSSMFGNAPKHLLFDRVSIKEKNPGAAVRSFDDYEVTFDQKDLPNGVEMKVLKF